jgi:hypothetical protein
LGAGVGIQKEMRVADCRLSTSEEVCRARVERRG